MQPLFVIIIISVLTAGISVNAQRCASITAEDLGNSSFPSPYGLIARRLGYSEDSPPLLYYIQLFNYNVVCEATAGIRDLYRGVSVVANYTSNRTLAVSQFDFSCSGVDISVWDIEVNGSALNTVITPPDANMETTLRRDCHGCLSRRPGLSNDIIPESHCLSE